MLSLFRLGRKFSLASKLREIEVANLKSTERKLLQKWQTTLK